MKKIFLLSVFSVLLLSQTLFSNESKIFRYPAASPTHIAFTHAGDIYTVEKSGGLARRITSSEGLEMFPRFSPDGQWIAFSAEYEGNREVYKMPAIGGTPQRLTYSMDIGTLPERMGPDKIIMQWSEDGSKIMYRSRAKEWNAWNGQLYYINADGGLPEQLPLPRAGFASLSPDGKKLAYNRVFREFRTWKRYRGGQADDIWIYDFGTKKLENITENNAQDIIPMWAGNIIYYISDKDSKMNLYSYNVSTKQTKQHTQYTDYDIKFPSLGPDCIVYEKGGELFLFDLATETPKKVTIEIAEDFPWARTKIENVKDRIISYEISRDGKRALFTARGDIFTVPAEKGKIYNLTESNGIHERSAVWSPDGKIIAYISDKSGEDEIYTCKPDGSDVQQITNNASSYRYSLMWSPDSKMLLCSDKGMNLYFIDIKSKKTTNITTSDQWEITDYTWSSDSKWVAYSDFEENGIRRVYLYSLPENKSYPVTEEFFNSWGPEFSSDGKYLFFLSDRTFNYSEGKFERSYTYNDMTNIYGLALQADAKSPFAFENDEVEAVKTKAEEKIEKEKEKEEKKKREKEEKSDEIKIDLKGLSDRIFELPTKTANYGGLTSQKDKLYYVRIERGKGSGFYNYDFAKKEENEVGEIGGYEISADGKSILFRSGKDYYIEKLDGKVKPDKGKLNLDDMKIAINPRAEWKQIYEEAWRQMKYFFYAPNMHGVDWKAVHDKYAALLPFVDHRDDLIYIIGEMIGELNCGHAYTGGGDMPSIKTFPIGLLGVDYEFDSNSGYYKIKRILKGRNWDDATRSPLTEIGIDVKEGDYLIAIDGMNLSKEITPGAAMQDKAGKYVTLKYNSSAKADGAKEITVKTIANESELRYYNWVERRRAIVDSLSGGKIGYVHIPDMLSHGLDEFAKYFYPQLRKEALIIDDRYNGGGNVSPMIIERLRRILTMAGLARNQKVVSTLPDAVFTGPMVCLINEWSASDGDMFPYEFKQSGLGKLIGKRSWGGVIGIRGSLPFLDGGYLYKPEFSHFSPDGEWVLEGEGMTPDIIVDNDPTLEFNGIDEQLIRAVEELKKELQSGKYKGIPKAPDFPDKSK